jgi:hypothetical protein
MSSNQTSNGRAGRALIALVALAATAGVLAVPAGAATGQGTAAMILAQHEKGRTLSGQGVKVLPGLPASQDGRSLTLPISAVNPGADASATGEGSLNFKRGKRSIALTGLRFNLVAGTLSGKLGDTELTVFRLDGPATANASSGNVRIDEAKLRLTADAADALKKGLGLARALRRDGVGMAWLSARANPTHEAAKAVVSGSADWGFLTSWRTYVLGQQGPPMSIGSITVEGGATANGNLTDAGAFFGFPATGGSYEKGLYGAADELVLKTQGSVKFAKPFHCIIEIKLADLEVTIDGASSSIVVGDYSYDIDKFNGMGCDDQPAVLAPGTKLATLDAGAVTPTYAADGKTVTWTAIPAALTAAGSVPFSPTYGEGQPLDPITITANVG